MSNPWVLYILSCGDGTLYTGITNDLDARLKKHGEGKGAKYTKGRGPLQLVYAEPQDSHSTALKRERAVKSLSRASKNQLISSRHDRPEHPRPFGSDGTGHAIPETSHPF